MGPAEFDNLPQNFPDIKYNYDYENYEYFNLHTDHNYYDPMVIIKELIEENKELKVANQSFKIKLGKLQKKLNELDGTSTKIKSEKPKTRYELLKQEVLQQKSKTKLQLLQE